MFILLLFSLIYVLSKAEHKRWMDTVNKIGSMLFSKNNHQGAMKTFLASVLGVLLLVLLYLVTGTLLLYGLQVHHVILKRASVNGT